jgi:hypothetical protein
MGGVLPANTMDKSVNTGGYFDFEIHGLTRPGQSVLVVIPQFAAIPADAVYRKYTESGGWTSFVEDTVNALWSAPGEAGICPSPGDSAYVPGLIPGYFCVQLMIEDGGGNDGDGKQNSAIADPGGVAVPAAAADQVANDSSTSGGGGGSGLVLVFLIPGILARMMSRRRRL